MHQRQESGVPAISGRKINNYFTCTVKQVKRLRPSPQEQQGPEKTYQTDSFKQILTKRSACPNNKENVSTQNKALRRIKEQASAKQVSQDKKKEKSNSKKPFKKSNAVSLTKLFEKNASTVQLQKKQTKSVSPSKDIKDYRSGPVQKKNYLSNNVSTKTREAIPTRSEKSLTDRVKNCAKSVSNLNKKQDKKQPKTDRKELQKTKKLKSTIKNPKEIVNMQKTQSVAKQLDCLLRNVKKKDKKKDKKKTSKDKTKKSKSKDKKIVVSHNTSKNLIQRHKLNSYFSQDSPDSPQKIMLSTRYQGEKQKAQRPRLSFQPSKKKGKIKQKAKTQALSPEKSLVNKNQAATIIQKVFRGYLTRKYIKQFKHILLAVITIQKMWRGYRGRKYVQKLRDQETRRKKQQLKLSKISMIDQSNVKSGVRETQLVSLLEEILHEQNINESIKNKISCFLKKQQKVNSSRSNSVISHMEQEMRSEKRYLEQMDRKKYKFGSPTIQYSPKLERSSLGKSPQLMIDNLMVIKQFQREKLINNAKLQIEGLENLALKNIFSPRTRDVKKVEIHRKLEEDLQKFDDSISEVIKTCKQTEDVVGQIKPFSGGSTPQKNTGQPHLLQKKKRYETSPNVKLQKEQSEPGLEKLNSSERKLQDLSMQLLQYYEQKTQQKGEKECEKIDSSYQFIEEYLLTLFEFLRQLGQQYRQKFIDMMRMSRNLQISNFLKNLNVLTEDSDEDVSFRLPMYKYLQQEEAQILEQRVSQQFNNSYKKLQRHQLGNKINIEEVYLKMIVDAVNEALNIERPKNYIFTEAALIGKSNRMRILELEALDGLDGEDNQPEFSFYFANSMNHIYKWAHFQCGRIADEDEMQQNSIEKLNQISMKQYLKFEVQKQENYYDELLQVIVALSNCVFDQIALEEGVNLFIGLYHQQRD